MKPLITGLIYLVLIVQLHLVAAKDPVCGFPGTPAYGYVKPDLESYEEGDVVSYSCRVGYILLGSPISRCTEDGSWTEDVPICDDSMTTLGVAFSTPTVPGYAAEMAIDRDKETCAYLKPKKPRWWRIDLGNIHKVLSVAVTMISPDKNVKFTIFVIKTNEGSASYKRCASFSGKFGTQTVVLSCAEGKGIVGEKVHIEDHLQTEGLFEICEVEVQVEKDTGYECGRPSRNLYSITYAPRGKRVDYGCIRGYEINGQDYRRCLSSGQWSDEPPVCEPIICDELEPLENGEIKLSHENGPVLEGAIAIYKCDEGFKLYGSFTRNCLKDGSWNDKPPQCKAIRCPVPDGTEVGGVYRLVNKSNSMGSVALLRCKRGKREGDNPYITCTEDGTWTKPEAQCILPAGASYERTEEPRIVNQGAVIFGMIVAAIMIVVVLVSMYLYTQKRRNGDKPVIPSRLAEPPVPPPRPPPRGAFRTALMGLMSRDSSDKSDDQRELQKSWKGEVDSFRVGKDDPAVIEVEVIAQDEKRKGVYPVPEENENTSLENVVLDVDGQGSSRAASPKSGGDYASVDYDKKRQSRLLKDQDSVDSSSTAAASPLPPDESEKKGLSHSPTPPKPSSETEEESEEEEEEDDESEKRKKEEEEKKAKEEEERKAKEEEERKAKEEEERKAKEEAEKKEKEAVGRRRRIRDEPPPVEEKPVLRRTRRLQ